MTKEHRESHRKGYNPNTIWSDYWLRHLPFRELVDLCLPDPNATGIQVTRQKRACAELDRRRRETFEGWKAEEIGMWERGE